MIAISSRLMSHVLFFLTRKYLYPSSSFSVFFASLSLSHPYSLSISYSSREIVLIFLFCVSHYVRRITNAIRNELVPTFVGMSYRLNDELQMKKANVSLPDSGAFFINALLSHHVRSLEIFLSAQFADVSALKSRALCTAATSR